MIILDLLKYAIFLWPIDMSIKMTAVSSQTLY